jgi:hypothetical protein
MSMMDITMGGPGSGRRPGGGSGFKKKDEGNYKTLKSEADYKNYVESKYGAKMEQVLKNGKPPDVYNALVKYNNMYQEENYEDINNCLRGGDYEGDGATERAAYSIDRYIDSNPLSENITFYRGMTLENRVIDGLKNGKIFRGRSITSMSTDENIARGFAKRGTGANKSRVFMEIKAGKGSKIAPLIFRAGKSISSNYGEREFMGSSSNGYRIKGVEYIGSRGKGYYHITAEVR